MTSYTNPDSSEVTLRAEIMRLVIQAGMQHDVGKLFQKIAHRTTDEKIRALCVRGMAQAQGVGNTLDEMLDAAFGSEVHLQSDALVQLPTVNGVGHKASHTRRP